MTMPFNPNELFHRTKPGAPKKQMPKSPDPYPRNDSAAAQRAAVEALAEIQRGRPLKPPTRTGRP